MVGSFPWQLARLPFNLRASQRHTDADANDENILPLKDEGPIRRCFRLNFGIGALKSLHLHNFELLIVFSVCSFNVFPFFSAIISTSGHCQSVHPSRCVPWWCQVKEPGAWEEKPTPPWDFAHCCPWSVEAVDLKVPEIFTLKVFLIFSHRFEHQLLQVSKYCAIIRRVKNPSWPAAAVQTPVVGYTIGPSKIGAMNCQDPGFDKMTNKNKHDNAMNL